LKTVFGEGPIKKALLISLFIVFISIDSEAVQYYEDGQSHDISTALNDSIYIYNVNMDRDGNPTTVNLRSGGGVYDVEVNDTSSFNMYDGSVDNIIYTAHSQGIILGGTGTEINVTGESSVTLSGGIFENVNGEGDCSISVSEGQFQGLMFVNGGNYTLEMSGGQTHVIDGSGLGYTTVSGGEIEFLVSNLSATVEVSGGLVSNLIAGDYSNSGLIVIHGTDFNYDYGYITDFSGTLIGTLESGESLLAEFSRFGDAQILLVPEPATLLLVGIGAVMMRKRK
jgi:hypothetical protein